MCRISTKPLVAAHLRAYFGHRELLWEYAPLFKYAEFNDRIGLKSVLASFSNAPRDFDAWGSRLSTATCPRQAGHAVHDTSTRSARAALLPSSDILEIARAHRVHVSIFVAPEFETAVQATRTGRDHDVTIGRSLCGPALGSWISANDASLSFGDTLYFRDPEHLNHHGAEKFSKELGDSLAVYWTEKR